VVRPILAQQAVSLPGAGRLVSLLGVGVQRSGAGVGQRALVVAIGFVANPTVLDAATVDDPGAAESFGRLDFALARAEQIAGSFRRFGYELVADAVFSEIDRVRLRDSIEAAVVGDEPVIVHFVGHGGWDQDTRSYYLASADASPGKLVSSGVNVCEQLDRINADPSGPPVLFVLDACGSGRAVGHVLGQDHREEDRRGWVLAAAHAKDPAYTGRFSAALATVLDRIADGELDLAASEEYVRLEKIRDLVQEVLDGEPGLRQVVQFTAPKSRQPTPPFIANPHYDPSAYWRQADWLRAVPDSAARAVLDEVADPEHFRSRAVGVPTGRRQPGVAGLSRCLFTGRSTVMTALSAWLAGSASQKGPLRVITGSPGSGKSAVLGALVCAAHPLLRQAMPEIYHRLAGPSRPAAMRCLAMVHARNRDLAEVLGSIGRQLARSDVPSGGWDTAGLLEMMRGLDPRPVLVIDGLDEAAEPVGLMRDMVLPLVASGTVRVVVGVRPWGDLFAPLLDEASADGGLIDLDAIPASALRSDLADYVAELLIESRHYGDYDLRHAVAAVTAEALVGGSRRVGSEFLAAGLFADYLDALPRPLTDLPAVRAAVPDSMGKLLEMRLARLGAGRGWLRPVLATLAHAKGSGMPRKLLTVGAAAVARAAAPTEREAADALEAARFYLRRSIDSDGTVLYRLFHRAFDDHLIEYPGDPERPTLDRRADASRLLDTLLAGLQLLPVDRHSTWAWDRAEPYLLRHAIEHAADAGRVDDLLIDPDFLVNAYPDRVVLHLAAATSRSAQESVAVYRTSLHLHRGVSQSSRRDILAADAARWGLPELAGALSRPPWRFRWATGSTVNRAFQAQLTRHSNGVNTVGISTVAGRPVAISGGEDGQLLVWDLIASQLFGQPLIGHIGPVKAVATGTMAGRPIAVSGGNDGTVRVWDLTTRRSIRQIPMYRRKAVHAVAIATVSGHTLVIIALRGSAVQICDLTSGEPRSQALAHTGPVTAFATATVDGRPVIITAARDDIVQMWDLGAREPVGPPWAGHASMVNAITTTDLDGRPVAIAACGDGAVRVWDLADSRPVGPGWHGHSGPMLAVGVANMEGRRRVISGDLDGKVWLWDLATGEQVGQPLRRSGGAVSAIATTELAGRPLAVTADDDGKVLVWDLSASEPVGHPQSGHPTPVRVVAVTGTDQPLALTGDTTGLVQFWDLATGERVGQGAGGHSGRVNGAATAIVRGGTIGVTAGEDWTLRLWELPGGEPIGQPLIAHPGPIHAMSTTTMDGRPVAVTGGHDWTARIWDLTGGCLAHQLAGHTGPVEAVATGIMEGHPIAVTADSDGLLLLWDLSTGRAVGRQIADLTGSIEALAVTSLSGRPVAVTSSNKGTLMVWNLDTGEATGPPLARQTTAVTALVTTEVGNTPVVITAGADRLLRTWDLHSGRLLLRTLELPEPIRTLAVLGEGDLLLIGFGHDIGLLALTPSAPEEP